MKQFWQSLVLEFKRALYGPSYAPPPAAEPARVQPLYVLLGGLGLALCIAVAILFWEGPEGSTVVMGQVQYEGQPLAGARVSIVGIRGCHTTTDDAGRFRLEHVPAGAVTLLIDHQSGRGGYPMLVPPRTAEFLIGQLPLHRWRPAAGVG